MTRVTLHRAPLRHSTFTPLRIGRFGIPLRGCYPSCCRLRLYIFAAAVPPRPITTTSGATTGCVDSNPSETALFLLTLAPNPATNYC